MPIYIFSTPIDQKELRKIADERFGDMVKAVVDIAKETIAIGGELHADEEALLLEKGSQQEDLWGINIYLDLPKKERVEFDSLINLRPRQNNLSRDVKDPKLCERIISIVDKLVA